MKKNQKRIIWIIAIINLMILSSTPLAFADSATPSTTGAATRMGNKKALPLETEFVFTGGYRRDDLDWSIAGDSSGNNPNILSELTWDDLESYQVKFQGNLVWPNIIALRGLADYGWISDGENQDSDYYGDNRTWEFSRSNNNSDDGDVWDVSLAIGYPFRAAAPYRCEF